MNGSAIWIDFDKKLRWDFKVNIGVTIALFTLLAGIILGGSILLGYFWKVPIYITVPLFGTLGWFGGKYLSTTADATMRVFRKKWYQSEFAQITATLGIYVIPKLQKEHTGIRLLVINIMNGIDEADIHAVFTNMAALQKSHPWVFGDWLKAEAKFGEKEE